MALVAPARMASPVRPNFNSDSGAQASGSSSQYRGQYQDGSSSSNMNGYNNGSGSYSAHGEYPSSPAAARAVSPQASSPFKVTQLSRSLNEAIGELPDDDNHGATRHSQMSPSRGRNNGATSPPARSSGSAAAAPRNPLIDLIDTEKGYVDDLAMVIKKVAAAWSRSNFPPPALDTMFRAIEAVYRIDKGFMARLNEIGPSPSSPKALGDLLMRWIDDLEPAYTRYVNAYQTDFDFYQPVQSNSNLLPILQALPSLSSEPNSDNYPTLDALFGLPLQRLAYYKKLYAKLLKSTQPGKSDHNLLVGANEKLDWLLDIGHQSAQRKITDTDEQSPPPQQASSSQQQQPASAHSSLTPSASSRGIEQATGTGRAGIRPIQTNLTRPHSDTASNSGSSSVERSSGQTTTSMQSTALSSDTSGTQQMSPVVHLNDLERRLDTSRTLDIFTMRPKKCKLQMNPPGLNYQRSIRISGGVQISFFPASDPSRQEVFSPSSYIFLLTDLFLLCERIPSPSTEQNRTNPSADMWLTYPPLATKHLKVFRVADPQAAAFEIEIMKKERMTVFVDSRQKRDEWFEHFQEAISFLGPGQALRVNTDIGGANSPNSATSATSAGPRANAFSPQSWNSGSGSTPSSLPPLPLSAASAHFPSSARSPTPNDGRALPMAPGPQHMPVHQGQGQGRQSPLLNHPPQQNMVFPPPRQHSSPPLGGGMTSPMQQSFSQPMLSRPSPHPNNPPNVHPGHNSYSNNGLPPHPSEYGNDPSRSNGGYPLPPGASGMQGPQALGLSKASSQRSVASFSSRSGSSTAPSPVPPLPNKEHHYDLHAAQQANQRMQAGMQQQQDMRAGGLLSPSGSSHAMGMPPPGGQSVHRSRSAEGLRQEQYRMPSSVLKESLRGQSLPSIAGRLNGGSRSAPGSRMGSGYVDNQQDDVSPPSSPVLDGPVTSQLAAEMKCKVFVQQAHGQWKSLGTAKLKLYLQSPTNKKQLVVASEKTVYISTIVLEDGVERVGKTGVAIELSDNGQRTGIVYMIQLKTEASATGFFQQLLLGSSRASAMVLK